MRKRRPAGDLKPVEKWEMRKFREAGMSVRACADYFDVSVATAMRALQEMREKLGPEQFPEHRRQFARPTLRRAIRNAPDKSADGVN